MTPGLPEEDVEAHRRPDPDSRGSAGPELPLARDDEDSDGEPPGLDDDASTIDYRDHEDAESEQEIDDEGDLNLDRKDSENNSLAYLLKGLYRDSSTECIDQDDLGIYLEESGTKVEDAPVEALDVQNGAALCWASAERELHDIPKGGDASHTGISGPLEVELSRPMSMLLVPSDGERLPALGPDGHYVVQMFPTGVKRTVVERAQNILTREEALQHEAECNRAMLEELQRWLNLGAFGRFGKQHAPNVIDARWALKWKLVNERRVIQARLVVRGFEDLQAAQLSTYAGTTTRWGQRLVNSVAAQYQ